MRIQQLFCARHFLPKTNLKQVILFKNPNNEGKFRKHLHFLETLQKQQFNTRKNVHTHFLRHQENKFLKWKEKDEQNIQKISLLNKDSNFTNKYVPNSHVSLKSFQRIENDLKCDEYSPIFPLQNRRKELPSLKYNFIRNANAGQERKHHFLKNRLRKDFLKQEKLLTDHRFLELCSILNPMEFPKEFVSSFYEPFIITASTKTGYYQNKDEKNSL
uniref:Uncharacterized protein n=1 Tax=Octopus bimaculoides TaxID=37653 RepID=A0A0L8FHX1_OCTBM